MQAVILAAGYGLRLRPHTEHMPKGLVNIQGKPLLSHTLATLPCEVSEIFIVTGYLGNQIQSFFGTAYQGIPISYTTQDPINGTGSALLTVKEKLRGKFLVLNGDDLYDKEDIHKLSKENFAMLCYKARKKPGNEIVVNELGNLQDITAAENTKTSYQVNCGAYVLNENFFTEPLAEIDVRGKTEYSLPHTLLAGTKTFPVKIITASYWLPIGTPEELAEANTLSKNFR
jgi:UDP-N-acetylglucosamine diphosphorylase / glucose-1-phosphate thymidylyltransferase / UDP-N-acetylgalactosamine diphosphorylase / glucosamine-1-phosphate N-acetyltransferase / galactosamine-1-phosphate N-acetyltransferase